MTFDQTFSELQVILVELRKIEPTGGEALDCDYPIRSDDCVESKLPDEMPQGYLKINVKGLIIS
jgi:hypothetical protein